MQYAVVPVENSTEGAIGRTLDLLLTTPLLARLKAAVPGVETHLLANDYNAWVVAGNPHVDRLWVYRRVRQGGRTNLRAA